MFIMVFMNAAKGEEGSLGGSMNRNLNNEVGRCMIGMLFYQDFFYHGGVQT